MTEIGYELDQLKTNELKKELILLGEHVLRCQGEFGISAPEEDRLLSVAIEKCRQRICPNKEKILEMAKSNESDIAVLIGEAIILGLGATVPGIPVLSRCIAILGIERFCKDPDILIR